MTLVKKENAIPVRRFVNGYNQQANEKLKEVYLGNNLKCIETYLPFNQKLKRIENLVKTTCFEPERDKNGNLVYGTVYKKDSVAQRMLYILLLIDIYTNIEIEYGNANNTLDVQYDALVKSKLIDKVFAKIPQEEQKEFDLILRMHNEDTYLNYGTAQSYISGQIDRFATIASTILSPTLEKIADNFENIDESKMDMFLSKLKNIIKK